MSGSGNLTQVKQWYRDGRFIDAWHLLQSVGESEYSSVEGRRQQAKLLMSIGATRRGLAMSYGNFQRHPTEPDVVLDWLLARTQRFDPWNMLQYMDRHAGVFEQAEPGCRGEMLGLRGIQYAMLHDFEQADRLLVEALATASNPDWIAGLQSHSLVLQDRHDQAMALIDEALVRRPWYLPLVMHKIRLLFQQGHLGSAERLLSLAVEHLQSADLHFYLCLIHESFNRHEQALASLDRMVAWLPLLDAAQQNRLYLYQANLLYCLERYDESSAKIEQVTWDRSTRQVKDYYQSMASRCVEPGFTACRRLLEVPYYHQKRDTCAPTSMAMLCDFGIGRSIMNRWPARLPTAVHRIIVNINGHWSTDFVCGCSI